MKYIVETIGMFRQVHVVEAENEEAAFEIAENADDNWQEFIGTTKLDINEFTEEQIAHYKKKEFYWDGVAFKGENGEIKYKHPNGSVK
jgi:uncharacterized protein YpmS